MNQQIKFDCPICGTHNLTVQDTAMQCQHCGMATDEAYKGMTKESESYIILQDSIKPFVHFIDEQMWVPSQVQFEFGGITPINQDDELYYTAAFEEEHITTKLFSEALGFVIEKYHGKTT